ncbi:bis-aminopropyl spermidine synthase family protein [Nocardiopsis sp. EMB25]|uniref:bis-aminopropyl spermidine synthase family protein n=2 Tax=Nocardiopsis TaxID=2013 RepID=UPI00228376CC|nr:bis-aminopropyl spermidine synthase family protein [Nocardiopsis sp. EMB25]MCY9782980.1 bis-aminopropyl spermidine synthase family protein [Nocardiopsis sp. EMB25]
MAGHPTSPGPDHPGAAYAHPTAHTPRSPVSVTSEPPQLLPQAALRLLLDQGVDAPRVRRILALLSDGRWWSANDLVRASRVAHSVVAAVLRELDEAEELDTESGDGQRRVRLVAPSEYRGAAADELADPVAHLLPRHARAGAILTRAVSEGPASDPNLDHVAATAETALRRALFLTTRFDLDDRVLLCVGDHDLTALAVTLVCPRARAEVVDVDERVLAHIDAVAEREGLPVRTHFADLRLGLPSPLRGAADLVFTDPPYTPDGVELFVRRGLEGMTDPRRGRVLVAYGASETTPRLAAATQARMVRMDLLLEAVWPDFNRYHGAESIGAASDLYVLRPLSRTAPAPSGDAARVYSQGVNAKEARGGLDAERADAVVEAVLDDVDGAVDVRALTLVGEWPTDMGGAAGAGRIRLSTWLAAPTSATEHAVINLTGGWERLVARAALAAASDTVYALVPSAAAAVRDQAGQRALRAMVEPRFEVRFLRGFGARNLTAVRFTRRAEAGTAADRLLTHVQERAHGMLRATLRGGLTEIAAWMGAPINKRTSRHAVAAAPAWLAGHTPLDLPDHRWAELPGVVRDLVGRVEPE